MKCYGIRPSLLIYRSIAILEWLDCVYRWLFNMNEIGYGSLWDSSIIDDFHVEEIAGSKGSYRSWQNFVGIRE